MELAAAIAKREGKKNQARIGEIREILRIIIEMEAEDELKGAGGNSPCALLLCRANDLYLKLVSGKKPRGYVGPVKTPERAKGKK